MASSVSAPHGDQEGMAYNGRFGCTCYHPLFIFNQFDDLERCAPLSVSRPPRGVRWYYTNFSYRAASWAEVRRVVAKVEWHPGELYPRVGFIVTNLDQPFSVWLPSMINAAQPKSILRRARTPSGGRDCHAASSPACCPSLVACTRLQPRKFPAHSSFARCRAAVVGDDA